MFRGWSVASDLNKTEAICGWMSDSADGSVPGSGSSKKGNGIHSSKEQRKLDELNDGIDFLSKRLSRRQAISTGAVAAAAAVGGLVIGGAAGYLLKPAANTTTTATSTVTGPTVTQ